MVSGERDTITFGDSPEVEVAHTIPSQGFYYLMTSAPMGMTTVYLEDEAHVQINVDTLTTPPTLTLDSSLEAENAMFASMQQRLGQVKSQGAFADFCQEFELVRDSLCQAFDDHGGKVFASAARTFLDFEYLRRRVCYQYDLPGQGKAYDADPDYNAFMRSLDLTREEMQYARLAYQYVEWEAKVRGGSFSTVCVLESLRDHVSEDSLRSAMAHQYVTSYFKGQPGSDIDSVYVLGCELDPEHCEAYDSYYNAFCHLLPGSDAPAVAMIDVEGKSVRLSDLYGKYLYIDVWATWCAPCCAEIPAMEQLVKAFLGNDKIAFVSISVDTDRQKWHKKLDADKPQWAQYVSDKSLSENVTLQFGISGIPRFIILDPTGKIVMPDAPRPSTPGMVQQLQGILGM